ncbi:DUF2971 domain-containing protein [Pseudoteredinibacter isoporae]|uniref:DUF2971 domain-containing protein n=1 Tax=Pseudoteredinibacter isoporae TaxID=570281 RepID=UPI003104C7E8
MARRRKRNKGAVPNPPKSLYKYCSIKSVDDNSGEPDYDLENLEKSQIYFNDPSNFNDPFDCKYSVDREISDRRFICEMKKRGWDVSQLTADQIKQEIEKFKETVLSVENSIFDKHIHIGVTCLCERWDSLLLWGHYANKHTGFCLEFGTTLEPFNLAERVLYKQARPRPKLVDLINNESKFIKSTQDAIKVKSKNWSYEKEWRVLHTQPNKVYQLHRECLKSITLGLRVEKDAREKVIKTIANYPEIVIYECYESKTSFSLNRRKIN